jgi:ABC-type multidrug transport system ATPase subunit
MPTLPVYVENLQKNFGRHRILNELSLSIDQGSAFGLVGLNGAGKTTLIRLLLGILKADSGAVSIFNSDPWKHNEQLYRRMGVVLEHDGFWGNLTVKENLKIFAAAKRVAWPEALAYVNQYWAKASIFTHDKKVKFLSRGQKMQCALCRAFLGWPELLIFDEPVIALDVEAYEHFRALVKTAQSRGASFLISSHQLETIDDICDQVGILRDQHLAEIRHPHESEKIFWIIQADENKTVAEILTSEGAVDIGFSSGIWRFSIDNCERKIPVIIKKLIGSGLDIMRVQPEHSGFSDEIRKLYRGAAGE